MEKVSHTETNQSNVQQKKAKKSKKRFYIVWIIILLMALFGKKKDVNMENLPQSWQLTAKEQSSGKNYEIWVIWDEVILNYNEDINNCTTWEKIVIASTQEDLGKLYKARIAKDDAGVQELLLKGWIVYAPLCSKAKVLGWNFTSIEVRLLENTNIKWRVPLEYAKMRK